MQAVIAGFLPAMWENYSRVAAVQNGDRARSTLLGHTPNEADLPLRRDSGHRADAGQLALSVESTTGAVAIGMASLFPRLSVRGAPLATPWLRFQSPLIEPDMRISRIRLSDKTSCFRPRKVAYYHDNGK